MSIWWLLQQIVFTCFRPVCLCKQRRSCTIHQPMRDFGFFHWFGLEGGCERGQDSRCKWLLSSMKSGLKVLLWSMKKESLILGVRGRGEWEQRNMRWEREVGNENHTMAQTHPPIKTSKNWNMYRAKKKDMIKTYPHILSIDLLIKHQYPQHILFKSHVNSSNKNEKKKKKASYSIKTATYP